MQYITKYMMKKKAKNRNTVIVLHTVCHMNKKFNHTARQVAHKSYPSCVVRATDISMEAYSNSYQINLSTGQVTKNVASPAQNEMPHPPQ